MRIAAWTAAAASLMLFAAAMLVRPAEASAEQATGGELVAERMEIAALRDGAGSPPRRRVLDLAHRAYRCAAGKGEIAQPYLSIIDFSLPSSEKRLWVYDMKTGDILFHELVAHGRNSGTDKAYAFSNIVGSKQSSLGMFRTASTYYGAHGYSMNLVGLEPGVNDKAYERRIVMHAAEYVDDAFLTRHGQLGRSWGCPAVSPRVHRRLIDTIKEGSAVFAYYPDLDWLDGSTFLGCDGIASGEFDGSERVAVAIR
jgi:hypothetical protein